jgi:hypothetical protein
VRCMSALCCTSGADDCCLGGRLGHFSGLPPGKHPMSRLGQGPFRRAGWWVFWTLLFFSPWVSASPPQITVQPRKWTVTEGGSYTFTVTAGGTAPLSFQWRKDDVDLADKTNSTLPLTLIQTNAAGLYALVITNLEGAVTSAPARLTVRLAADPVYAPPQGGWAYLFGGDSAAGSLSAALDGT